MESMIVASFSVAEAALRGRKVATPNTQLTPKPPSGPTPLPPAVVLQKAAPITGRLYTRRSRACCRDSQRDAFPRVSVSSAQGGRRPLQEALPLTSSQDGR